MESWLKNIKRALRLESFQPWRNINDGVFRDFFRDTFIARDSKRRTLSVSMTNRPRNENEKFLRQEADDASLQLAHSSIPDTPYRDEGNLNETQNGVRNWCSCKCGAGVRRVETRINPRLATRLLCTPFFFFSFFSLPRVFPVALSLSAFRFISLSNTL